MAYITNPSEKVQLEAVKKTPYTIEFIHNPSEKVQLAAVKRDCYSIRYIHNPTKKVQLEVIEKDPTMIQYINNPSKAVIKYLLDNYISDIEIVQLLSAKIGREWYDKLSDEDKLRLELED